MPRELRKIIFSRNELQAALVSYLLHSGRSMPNRSIDRLDIGEGLAAVTIVFQPGDATEVQQWPLSQ